ncbi:LuxR C-terminal-related transcriptional regulator [Streptantibioticus silvisoli]|uniref:Helix-turn-helix transcriptional regulator n=1 Tax=Streptantibioticus silvisoli TaxID=2705255 RepID=A0ABT6W4V5_9ACTN|nr:helix-turn-helix transcriptional regulator [Streptantibioticus silvisoli]MDI5965787.1 helix-turn-helix transcriptional regulator [Streptantibioticus silvisoli]
MTPFPPALTDRQQQILRLAAEGLSRREIAAALFLAEGTVDYHERIIIAALGARNLRHAVNRAWELQVFRWQRHGDHAGYTTHQRRGEPPCEACRSGEAVYRAGLKTRRDAA